MQRPPTIDERFAQIEALLSDLRNEVAKLHRLRADEPDVFVAATKWLHGLGWDECYSREMILDEFGVIERRARVSLRDDQVSELIGVWEALRAERFPGAIAA